jgi:TolB-like protein/DNA-binding winged helix-turn-helix (wHTH) protein
MIYSLAPDGTIEMKRSSVEGNIIRFGPFEADLASRELRKEGRKVKLQEQPFRVLSMLLAHPGQVVTREQLHQALWPADTFVAFDHGLNTAIKKLRQALDDSADGPGFIETLPRQGYRFVGVVSMPAETKSHEADLLPQPKQRRPRLLISGIRIALLLSAMLAIGLGTHWILTQSNRRPSPSGEISVAVIPFANMSAAPDNDYFGHGLTEELMRTLMNVPQLRVFAAKAEDFPGLAKKIGVRAVLSGSVRKSKDRLRITANLVEAADGRLLWVESYDRQLKEVIVVQEEIARMIVDKLEVRLSGNQRNRLVNDYSVDLDVYTLYLKGRYQQNKLEVAHIKKAKEYFEEVIARDASFARAYAGLGDCYAGLYDLEVLPPAEALDGRRKAVQKALELDPTLPEAIATRGGVGIAVGN